MIFELNGRMIFELNGILTEAFDALEAGNLDDTRTAIQGALEIAIKLALAQEIQAGLKRDMALKNAAQAANEVH